MSPAPNRTEMARLNGPTMDLLRVIAAARRETIGDVVDRLALASIQAEYAAIIDAAAMATAGTRKG